MNSLLRDNTSTDTRANKGDTPPGCDSRNPTMTTPEPRTQDIVRLETKSCQGVLVCVRLGSVRVQRVPPTEPPTETTARIAHT
jgi:hypothetical protein